jgi:hypothetical protein
MILSHGIQQRSVPAGASAAATTPSSSKNGQQQSTRTLAFGHDASITKKSLFPHSHPATFSTISKTINRTRTRQMQTGKPAAAL